MWDIEEMELAERLEWIRAHLEDNADSKWVLRQILNALIADALVRMPA